MSRLGTTGLDALCSAGSPNTTALYALKTSFPECEVTTWLHNPSYGLKEIRKATGFKDFYLYNALGDLSDVQDHNQILLPRTSISGLLTALRRITFALML